jgi:hypothetical protein
MIGLLCFVLAILASPFKSKLRLEAENAVLRHQLIVLKRSVRTHRSLNKDAPVTRQIQRIGSIKSHAILGGLHHHYARA